MKSGTRLSRVLAGVVILATAQAPKAQLQSYAPATPAVLDTLRTKSTAPTTGRSVTTLEWGAVVPGYLSARGLPPVEGRFTLTESGLVFRSTDGLITTFPLVGPLRQAGGRQWRASSVSLAYTDEDNGRPVYIFRIDAGVFETDNPGPLLDVASHPGWLDSLASVEWPVEQPMVNAADSAALWNATHGIASSAYADSLYLLFGQPRAPVGLIGRKGRSAGRLGEYIPGRDSLALDPGRMFGKAQLRHAMAHELGHRWQSRAPGQLQMLWSGVAPIRDPRRYGYGDESEQQAEAIAFAVTFLQTTASTRGRSSSALTLLDHYELLVPGTRTMVRYLSLQPLYRKHPLRTLLTTGR
ncbi:MAG: hypothetical protein ACJ8BF_01765 [Gemmatimonadales bacterium]